MHSRSTTLPPASGGPAAGSCGETDGQVAPGDVLEWSWPPYAPLPVDSEPFDTAEWAPPSVVWHPQLRLGRWTVVYRRTVC
ncbi:hypothetical protein [Modestobacter sp. VKM Ac-2978]|uniref:hypothetical protein n=1 Tax=Modestobacter sp. VKM Ac-2978 TaxID=3004132 RepID=UPI0022AAB145|nr:hypothetical protein [Modestobacter sp. VKM Ac-2978]MCZ2850143.1 hypothetical protein [Modestobacter sp. VKM Ac-2978]